MAKPVPARLTTSDLRKFGVVVGFAFVLLGIVVRWRGMGTPAQVLWYVGGTLFVLGLLLPAILGPVYRAWMGLALLISKVTTPIIMAVLYFLVITPMGLVLRAVGHRPLVHGRKGRPAWITRDTAESKRSDMERQF